MDLPNFAGDPTIRYVTWSVDGDKAYNNIIYEKTGVVCNVEPMEGGAEKLLTQVAGGVGPDVLFVDAYWQGDFFRKGQSQDFEPYLRLTTSAGRGSPTIHGSKTAIRAS